MILDKDVLVNNILTEISDNSTGQISPHDIRHNLLDIVDSVHLLTIGKPLNGSNFGTGYARTTRVGEESLSKIHLPGYFTIDNTAVGYASLKANYQGIKNTAIGSHSLFCNVYGEYNSALGYSSLGGNTIGIGNVGVGSYALNNNKTGNFNIAIGHGAAYYLSNGASNKLFIASHPIDSGYICSNPLGSGLTPLVYGDLSELKLGIGVTSLVDNATLQIGGNTIPSSGNVYNLGASGYRWSELYTRLINFDNDVYLSGLNGAINCNASILPTRSTDTLGSTSQVWDSGFFNNIIVTGVAQFARLTSYENCNYFCHTINISNPSSGNIGIDGGGPESLFEYAYENALSNTECGLPSDISVSGAGITINTSGVGYQRTYSLLFEPIDNSLSCLHSDNAYSRSSWKSNISLHLTSGTHLRTDRILFPSSINILDQNGCFGLFSRSSGVFFAQNSFVPHSSNPASNIAGVGNVNFYGNQNSNNDYVINFATPESGVTLRHRLLTGIKTKVLDPLNNNKDKLRGFEFQYIDDSTGLVFGPTYDRLVIGSYNNTSEFVNAITLLKSNQTEGIFGINNLSPLSKNIVPVTSLNVRSASNAIGRFTAENESNTIAAIQLMGRYNCLYDGFELSYRNGSGITDLSIYKESGKLTPIRLHENGTVGIFTASGSANEMFTLGDSFNNDAVISIYQNNTNITPTTNYGKLYIKPKIRNAQSHALYFMDGSGNVHDLILNIQDSADGKFVYTDPSGNTFAGLFCPNRRDLINGAENNTGYGNSSLYSLTTGDGNTVIGFGAGSGLVSGNNNTIIGSNSARNITTGSNNVVIGNNSFNNTSNSIGYSIILGSNGVGNALASSYKFIVGYSGIVLLNGDLGPSNNDKQLSMPNGGRFILYDNTNTDSLQLKANYIDVVDSAGSDFPNNNLTFRFNGNLSANLLHLNHSAQPMNNNAIYQNPIPPRPYAELNGDLKLRGAIRFSDSTSLSSSSFLNDISILNTRLNDTNSKLDTLSASFIEGYVDQQIDKPSSPSSPTSGIMYTKNQFWANNGQVVLVNKDPTSIVHSGAYVVAMRINNEFRPIWISSNDSSCICCK